MLPAVRTDEEWQAVVFDEKTVRPARKISRPASAWRVLDYLSGRLPVTTPELVAHGEYENGWRYVLMSQLPGIELAAAWPAIPRPHQDRIVSEAGEMLAALHGLDPGPLHAILGPADWAGFLVGQRATAAERQRAVELPDLCLSELPASPEPTLDSLALTWFGTT